jgi:hypothetical protein
VWVLSLLATVSVGCSEATRPGDASGGHGANDPPTADNPLTSPPMTPGQPDSARKALTAAGVVFVHGTTDLGTDDSLECNYAGDQFRCVVPRALETYWPREAVESVRTRTDGTMRPFAVVGCPLGSQTPWPNHAPVRGTEPEPGSAACVGAQIARFLSGPDGQPDTADDIRDIAIVTHSGGANVVRYLLQQHTAMPAYARIHAAARVFVALAAPAKGTYLANAVFKPGSFLGLGTLMTRALGEGAYDDDGTSFIQTTTMEAHNHDPAKLVDLAKDVAGVPVLVGSGVSPDATSDDRATCGGSAETSVLHILHDQFLAVIDRATFRDGCSDGFITCQSAMALANGDPDRVIFGRLDDGQTIGETHFRNHNQSRQACAGTDVDVRNAINAWLGRAGVASAPGVPAGGWPTSRLSGRSLATSWPTERPHEPLALPARPIGGLTPIARIVQARTRARPGVIEVTVDVRSSRQARLGVRAELVATDASGRSWTLATAQAAEDAVVGDNPLTLALPSVEVAPGDVVSIRNVALVWHDRAETVDLLGEVDVASP